VVNSRGVVRGYDIDVQFTSASVVKAMLLVAYLRAHATITSDMSRTLRLMITESDNAAAFKVFAAVGPAGLTHLAGLTHMKHFTVGEQTVLYSRITASDQARYFYAMDNYIPRCSAASRAAFSRASFPPRAGGSRKWRGRRGTSSSRALVWSRPGPVHAGQPSRTAGTWRRDVVARRPDGHEPALAYAFVTLRGVTARLLAD